MRNTLIFLAFAALVVFAACSKLGLVTKGQYYKCPDGRDVMNVSECNVTRPVNMTPPAQKPIVNLTNATVGKNTSAERNYSTLRKRKEENTTMNVTLGGSLPDLNGWSVQEIVDGMSAYDDSLRAITAGSITYDPKDQRKYWIGNNQLTRTEDPFWVARAPFQGSVKEYTTYHFRIWLSQRPKEFLTYVEGKRNDSKFKLLYPDLWAEWDAINCTPVNSCRNIEAVKCDRGSHTLWMWTHNTPGAAYTGTTRYNMQAFDDDRKTLAAFEKFYCTPV